jgi:hypothetical protein
MITYNLNTEDVSNLIKAHLCDDLMITNMEDYSVISSDSDKLYTALYEPSLTGGACDY